jgi:hypothetical protein
MNPFLFSLPFSALFLLQLTTVLSVPSSLGWKQVRSGRSSSGGGGGRGGVSFLDPDEGCLVGAGIYQIGAGGATDFGLGLMRPWLSKKCMEASAGHMVGALGLSCGLLRA